MCQKPIHCDPRFHPGQVQRLSSFPEEVGARPEALLCPLTSWGAASDITGRCLLCHYLQKRGHEGGLLRNLGGLGTPGNSPNNALGLSKPRKKWKLASSYSGISVVSYSVLLLKFTLQQSFKICKYTYHKHRKNIHATSIEQVTTNKYGHRFDTKKGNTEKPVEEHFRHFPGYLFSG